jgi:hypothetical protein
LIYILIFDVKNHINGILFFKQIITCNELQVRWLVCVYYLKKT